jgi:hypothetical protein
MTHVPGAFWLGRHGGQNSGLRVACKLLVSVATMPKHPTKSTNIRDLAAPAKPAAPTIQHPLAGKKMTGA